MRTLLDCNNFWSPSGGGVRRYHLEKMEYFRERSDVRYVFVMNSDRTETEQIGPNAFIEHIRVRKVPGNWEYRYLFSNKPLAPIFLKYQPDVIEVGSPYVMPRLVLSLVKKLKLKSNVYGFWHADFPVTYVGRFLQSWPFGLQKIGETLAWKYARRYYNEMSGTLVASEAILSRMQENGLKNLHHSPLGVHTDVFHPEKRDERLREIYQDGEAKRLLLFFPHRFSKEKGLHILLEAYALICEKASFEPALILAGTGPYQHWVEEAAQKYQHVHFVGFINSKEDMARHYASSDLVFALSEWETFGLSLIEAYSCGTPAISSPSGAAPEHVKASGAGIVLDKVTPHRLANAILEIHASSVSHWRNAARSYAEKLSWTKCFENQLAIYFGE